ncbi:glycosyltransferase family 2 protein [Paenibacillus apii]|uniref:glycosyltransferase family 2 protein n=1 Tax=Paenibacillus apii TaxID=1850370 RepID=UPI00143BD77A|nr:glycosyltransferase family 2 protein [Paenibacillus apii]NJJ41641.1 glycosyltransferase family 2 protein [Paenibacillus apii]
MTKISVVVPIFNVEQYLERCLDSIINQSYKDLEIILVNDGSTDRCYEICETYKQKDRRIVVIHQQNGGLSEARNTGISRATGEYIGFVDSDDYIERDMYQFLYNLIKKYNAEISICGTYITYDNKRIKSYKNNIELLMDSETAIKHMLEEIFFNTSAWDKLYNTSLFKEIKYPSKKLSEDLFTTYKLFNTAQSIAFSSEAKYFYCQTPNSIMRSDFNLKKLDTLEALREISAFAKQHYPSLLVNVNNRYVRYSVSYISQMIKCGYDNLELIEEMRNSIKENLFDYFTSSYKFSSKLFALGLVIHYPTLKKIYEKF